MGRDVTDKEQMHYHCFSQTPVKIIYEFPATKEELDQRLAYRVWEHVQPLHCCGTKRGSELENAHPSLSEIAKN